GDTLVGSGLNGRVYNNASLIEGKIGQGINLDGRNQWIDLGQHRDECFGNLEMCPHGYTLSMWLKVGPKNAPEMYYFSSGGQTRSSYGITLHWLKGKLDVRFSTRTKIWTVKYDGQMKGQWHHVVLTWNRDNELHLWVDGDEVAEDAEPTARNVQTTKWNDITMGRPNNAQTKYGQAVIDELIFWDKRLDDERIEGLWDTYQGNEHIDVVTPNNDKVHYVLNTNDLKGQNYVRFELKTCKGASVYMGPQPTRNYTLLYQVHFGGGGNTYSFINKGKGTWPRKLQINTPGIVDCDEYQPFWVSWTKGRRTLTIAAGTGLCVGLNQILQWTDTSNIWNVNNIGIGAYYNAHASWRFYKTIAHEDCHRVTGPYYLQSLNYPTHEWGINANKELYIVKGGGHRFDMVQPGLTSENETVSFESHSEEGDYLRHLKSNLHLEHPEKRNSKIFALDSTFRIQKNQWFVGYLTFESVNYRGQYIRHQGYQVKISKFENTDQFKKDASFKLVHECKLEKLGKQYMGRVSETHDDIQCQRWDAQTPHSHSKKDPSNFPDKTLADANNYCRNPDNEPEGPWCYTMDEEIRWQYCDVPYCDEATIPTEPPVTTPVPGPCPLWIGREMSNLPRVGGLWIHIMTDNIFPCDGVIDAFE
ncbi:unnamed protein product, partial [Owenia fusiformis]